jgi:hypothetical protein
MPRSFLSPTLKGERRGLAGLRRSSSKIREEAREEGREQRGDKKAGREEPFIAGVFSFLFFFFLWDWGE